MVIVKKKKVVQSSPLKAVEDQKPQKVVVEMTKKKAKKVKKTVPEAKKQEENIEEFLIDGADFTDDEEAMEVEEKVEKRDKKKKTKNGKSAPAEPAVASGSESEDFEDDEDFGIDEEDVEGEDLDFDDDEQEDVEDEGEVDDEEGDDEAEDEEEDEMETGKKHQKDLLKLKETDPEFFKFMQEQDADLLEFHESDAEDEQEDEAEEEEGEEEEAEGGKSRAPKARKDGSGRLIFDGNMYDYLESILEPEDESKLKRKPEVHEIVFVVDAFQACVARVGADIDPPRYIINEQAVFESTVRICFQNLGDLFKRLIKYQLENADSEARGRHKSKQFKKYQPHIKQYLTGVLLFLNEVQTDAVIVSTLKTIHHMLELYANVAKIARNLIKALVRIWTRKTLNCRIVAYVCMNELLKTHPEFLSAIYKSCYLGFVSNSREITAETWPLLQFMHRTFAELTLVVPESAYPYAFVYIRQTAIHLRNAIIAKKRKDLVATIYNWQMIQCLYLWVRVVSKAHSVNGAETICELAYPLTQIIIGVMQLYPSPRYLPLRFHCISLLIQLQASCTTYIPVLNLGSELLHELAVIFEKRPSPSGSAKAGDLDCFIKVTTQTLEDPAWRVSACEHLFKLLLQASHIMCSQPAFPDMVRPALHKIRAFCKAARGDHARLFRGLQDKLNEQAKFISTQLQLKDVDLGDEMNVRALKFSLNSPDSPLRTYYRQWEKVWKMKQEVAAKASDSDKKKAKEPKKGAVVVKDEEDEDVKPEIEKKMKKKKKRVTTPAAKNSDPTLPDTVADLGDWSD